MEKKTKILIAVVAILIAAALGTGAYFLFFAKDEDETSDTGTPATTTPAEEDTEDTEDTTDEIPGAHTLSVPYYGELGFCYGSSSMMILEYYGFSDEEVLEYEAVLKDEGQGGPPDMFLGFEELNLADKVHIGYSTNYDEASSDFYNEFLDNPDEQVITFGSSEEAFNKLKQLISSDIPVIVLIDNGDHYVVATGYSSGYVYVNDTDPEQKDRMIENEEFIDEWNVSSQEVGINIGFPGDYGMVWLEK